MDNAPVETSTTELRPAEPQGHDVGLTINAILKIIFYTVVMLLGLFGNSLILGVYWPKPNKTSTHILIMGLAGMDLTVCMMRVYNLVVYTSFLEKKKTPSAVEYMGVIGVVNVFASSVLTGFIAVDRYDCVCRPNNRWLNRYRAKLGILGSYGLAVIVACPATLQSFWMPDSNALQKAALVFQLALYVVVVVCICIFYGKVYITVRQHVKVNALSRRLVENDRSTAACSSFGPSRNLNLYSITGNVSTLMPLTKIQPGEKSRGTSMTKNYDITPSLTRKSDNRDARNRDGKLLKAELSKVAENDKSVATTDGTVNVTPSDRLSGGRHPNQDKRRGTEMSLQRKTTRMLFITSVVFLLTWFPYWLYVAVSLAKLDGANIDENVLSVLWYCTLTVYVNNVVNPLIYGVSNRRFRKDCQVVLKKIKIL